MTRIVDVVAGFAASDGRPAWLDQQSLIDKNPDVLEWLDRWVTARRRQARRWGAVLGGAVVVLGLVVRLIWGG